MDKNNMYKDGQNNNKQDISMKYVEEQCNGTNRDPKTTVLTIVFPLLCNERSVGRSRPMVAAFLQTCLSVAKENTFKVPKQLKKKVYAQTAEVIYFAIYNQEIKDEITSYMLHGGI